MLQSILLRGHPDTNVSLVISEASAAPAIVLSARYPLKPTGGVYLLARQL